MSYQEELSKPEWRVKRLLILKRDEYKCQSCYKQRSDFINLIKGFGILTLDQVLEKGYSLRKSNGYDGIEFFKDNWPKPVRYIGDKNKPFELARLRFALKKIEANFGGILWEGYSLICFYEEIFTGKDHIDLNIHHKLYIEGKKPWEYNDEVLISLCSDCHENTHGQNEIYVYNQHGDKLYKTENCPRCNGAGFLKEYDYYLNGVCFQCGGEGVILGVEKS